MENREIAIEEIIQWYKENYSEYKAAMGCKETKDCNCDTCEHSEEISQGYNLIADPYDDWDYNKF